MDSKEVSVKVTVTQICLTVGFGEYEMTPGQAEHLAKLLNLAAKTVNEAIAIKASDE